MPCFQNILMIAPQAERTHTALERPVALAQACDAAVTVVDVLGGATPPRVETTMARVETTMARVETTMARVGTTMETNVPAHSTKHVEQLAELVDPFMQRGVNIAGRVLAGEPVAGIIRQVEQNGHDLVVVPVAAQISDRGKLVGIPTMPLLRGCPCPVWVLKPTPALPGGILVAVNPGSAEDQDGALSQSLIRLAACFARSVGSPLSILHVWHLAGEPQIRRPLVGASSEQIAAVLDTAYQRAAMDMQQLLDKIDLKDIPYELYLEKGHQPAKSIAEFAVRRKIETVVMGVKGRSGITGLLVGNSAEEVLRGVPCSVVTLGSGCSFPPVIRDAGLPASKQPADARSRTRRATESTGRMQIVH
jgi:nucleotide-binding universal stress UspA family protein